MPQRGFRAACLQLVPSMDLWRLVLVRGSRSLVQGYLLVVFAIYLGQIGFPAWLIGLTLTIGGLTSAALTLTTGLVSDRLGRRPFLLAYSALLAMGGLILAFTTIRWLIVGVSALAAIGRGGGAGGSAGPFAPAEQALIAEKALPPHRTRVFAINTVVGTVLSASGALLAGIPELLRRVNHLSLVASYRPLYLGVAAAGVFGLVMLWPLTEQQRQPLPNTAAQRARRQKNRRTIGKIAFAGAFNGASQGFLTGIIPYWLHVRFGVSPGAIAPILTGGLLLTSVFSLLAVRLAARFGDVMLITGSRLVGVVLTVALPLAPIYPLAAALYGARMVASMMAMPVRQSYTMGIVEPETRGSAAGISGVARRLPASVSPTLSGYWIGIGVLDLPFFAAGLFACVNAILYFAWFRHTYPLDELAEEEVLDCS